MKLLLNSNIEAGIAEERAKCLTVEVLEKVLRAAARGNPPKRSCVPQPASRAFLVVSDFVDTGGKSGLHELSSNTNSSEKA